MKHERTNPECFNLLCVLLIVTFILIYLCLTGSVRPEFLMEESRNIIVFRSDSNLSSFMSRLKFSETVDTVSEILYSFLSLFISQSLSVPMHVLSFSQYFSSVWVEFSEDALY